MANTVGKRKALGTNDHRIPWVRRGYEQARLGFPPSKEDTLIPNQIYAQSYWQGWLAATNVFAAGLVPPAWNTERMAPPKVRAATRESVRKTGTSNCSRDMHLPPDPNLSFVG